MKITFDTEEKKIIIHGNVKLNELLNAIHDLIGDRIQEYTLEIEQVEKIVYVPIQTTTYQYIPQPYMIEIPNGTAKPMWIGTTGGTTLHGGTLTSSNVSGSESYLTYTTGNNGINVYTNNM